MMYPGKVRPGILQIYDMSVSFKTVDIWACTGLYGPFPGLSGWMYPGMVPGLVRAVSGPLRMDVSGHGSRDPPGVRPGSARDPGTVTVL